MARVGKMTVTVHIDDKVEFMKTITQNLRIILEEVPAESKEPIQENVDAIYAAVKSVMTAE